MPSKNAINTDNHMAVNGHDTFGWIARSLKRNGRCIVGWSDNGKDRYDLLFSFDRQGMPRVGKTNPLISNKNLFVSILGVGAFSVEMNNLMISPSFIGQNVSTNNNQFMEKLSELVGEVKVRL